MWTENWEIAMQFDLQLLYICQICWIIPRKVHLAQHLANQMPWVATKAGHKGNS